MFVDGEKSAPDSQAGEPPSTSEASQAPDNKKAEADKDKNHQFTDWASI